MANNADNLSSAHITQISSQCTARRVISYMALNASLNYSLALRFASLEYDKSKAVNSSEQQWLYAVHGTDNECAVPYVRWYICLISE